MTHKRPIIIIGIIFVILLILLSLFVWWYNDVEPDVHWGFGYIPEEYNITQVNNAESAVLAIQILNLNSSSHFIEAGNKLRINDVYFTTISNEAKPYFIDDISFYDIEVWRFNASLFRNTAIGKDGTVYRGCLLYGAQHSECGVIPYG